MPLTVRVTAALGAALLALAVPGTAQAVPATASGSDKSLLTVVHGVRGLVADVQLDGKTVLSGFAPERVTEPLEVSAGKHRVKIWRSGDDTSDPALLDTTIDLPAGGRSTAGVGIGADEAPFLEIFDDEALLPKASSTTLAVRGLAEATDVRVTADDKTVARSLEPQQEDSASVKPGTYEVTALDGEDSTPLVAPQDVPVAAGRAVVIYLIGSEKDKTLGWVAQTVRPGVGSAPNRMDTGVGPLPERPVSDDLPAALLLVPVGLLAGAVQLRRSSASS